MRQQGAYVSDSTDTVHETRYLENSSEGDRRASGAFSRSLIPMLLVCMDVLAIIAAQKLASAVYLSGTIGTLTLNDLTFSSAEVTAMLFVVIGISRGLYGKSGRLEWDNVGRQISQVTSTWVMVVATVTAILFTLKLGADFSRGVTLLFFGFGLMLLVVARAGAWRLIEWAFREGYIIRKRVGLLIIGEDQWSDTLGREGVARGVSVNRIWTIDSVQAGESATDLTKTVISDLRDRQVDELLICASAVKLDDVRIMAESLRLAPLRVRLLVDPSLVWPGRASSTRISDNAIELSREPLSTFEQAVKRSFDIVAASAALLMLAPLLALVALAIRLESRGPILFRQHRDGFNDAPFLIYKFRSMRVTENGPVVVQAKRNDARVTAVGRLIRRTSIDELPQLLNVLRGDMSIVGPRPHAVAHGQLYSSMIGDYAHRHHVKPGLTGWAQVNGSRGPTPTMDSMKRRVDLDIWYIGNWSFWLDIRIIFLTVRLIFTGKDAY